MLSTRTSYIEDAAGTKLLSKGICLRDGVDNVLRIPVRLNNLHSLPGLILRMSLTTRQGLDAVQLFAEGADYIHARRFPPMLTQCREPRRNDDAQEPGIPLERMNQELQDDLGKSFSRAHEYSPMREILGEL